ncbi:hypothetical protein LTR53_009878 [Teratosphaeriaceae sp. CCFEE 6253]|nr:hypothetical protein LTR53_009878 [Teratosphaeriaceae sp. CCFEE 6253]
MVMTGRITNERIDPRVRAIDEVRMETIAVNRFGSMCHPSSPTGLPTSRNTTSFGAPSLASTSTPTSSSATSLSAALPSSASSDTTSSTSPSSSTTSPPAPSTTNTLCTDPTCPLLNHTTCLSPTAGSTYGILCDTGLTGLVAFPLLKAKRTFTASFTACLALCDKQSPGCKGASWTPQPGGGEGGNCLIYGSVTGEVLRNGTTAARRLATYGSGGGGGGAYGGLAGMDGMDGM